MLKPTFLTGGPGSESNSMICSTQPSPQDWLWLPGQPPGLQANAGSFGHGGVAVLPQKISTPSPSSAPATVLPPDTQRFAATA